MERELARSSDPANVIRFPIGRLDQMGKEKGINRAAHRLTTTIKARGLDEFDIFTYTATGEADTNERRQMA